MALVWAMAAACHGTRNKVTMGLPVWNTGECPWCNAVAPLDRRFGTVLCSGCRRDVLEILAGEDLLEDTQAQIGRAHV